MLSGDRRHRPPGAAIAGWLAQPFPIWRGARAELAFVLSATALVTLLVLVTRPFGLRTVDGAAAVALIFQLGAACGAVSLMMRVGLPFLLERSRLEQNWNVARQLAVEVTEIVLLAGALMGILGAGGYIAVSAQTVATFLGVTALCAVPVLIIRLLLAERRLRLDHECAAQALPDRPRSDECAASSERVSLTGRDETFECDAVSLRYVRAEENYAEIVWAEADGALRRKLMRITLAEAANDLNPLGVAQCHRSYLVRLGSVRRVTGNAQGYRLTIDNVAETIPVSRSKARAFLNLLKAARSRLPSTASSVLSEGEQA